MTNIRIKKKHILLAFALICWAIGLGAQDYQYFAERPIFVNGTDGYACFRIPAIIKTPTGDLLAFAEGRVKSCADFGDLDIVMRRSTDNGMTWGKLQVVVENDTLQAGNPAPVIDLLDPTYPDGRIFMVYNTGNNHEGEIRQGKGFREVWFKTSSDQGKTWSAPTNITTSVHRPKADAEHLRYNYPEDWRSYANTPGHALQLTKGKYAGRLFIPANHSVGEPVPGFNEYRAHAFFSDDHGKSWQLSESVPITSSNESIAVELEDGRVMQNIRQQSGEQRQRLIALSSDGGAHWDTTYFDPNLPAPVCQASLLVYHNPKGQRTLLFSNPENKWNRENMTVKVSFDEGQTWLVSRTIRVGEGAYSDLVEQNDGKIGLLYEHGSGGGIHYAHFNYQWLISEKNHTDSPWVKRKHSAASDFMLARPQLQFADPYFRKQLMVRVQHGYPGTKIFYTLDGKTPDESSNLYKGPIQIEKTATLKVRAFHSIFEPSEAVEAKFKRLD